MRTVVVLGAGASKAYEESPTGQRMPIARDFFDTFESLPISTHPWVLREALVFYLERNRNVDALTYLRSGIDIEELHSEILDQFLALPVENENFVPLVSSSRTRWSVRADSGGQSEPIPVVRRAGIGN